MCIQMITEQAYIPLSRGAEEQGKCGSNESELQISWIDKAYTLRLYFVKVNDGGRLSDQDSGKTESREGRMK